MKRISVLFISGLMVVVTSCGPSREKSIDQINMMENQLFSPEAVSFNKKKADSLMAMYDSFIKDHPKDSLVPGYLFKAANIAMNSDDAPRAIGYFDHYIEHFPDQPKAPMCMFFKAFVYENQMKNIDKAREIYLQFIEKYPAHDFASQAKLAVMNLGKTPEMLVSEFEEKQKADSARVADSLSQAKKTRKRK